MSQASGFTVPEPRGEFYDFDLLLESVRGEWYTRVMASPAGVTSARSPTMSKVAAMVDADLLAFGAFDPPGMRDLSRSRDRHALERIGGRLFDALLPGELRSTYLDSVSYAASAGRGLRLNIRTAEPALAGIPWELCHADELGRHLTLSRQTPVIRAVPVRHLKSQAMRRPVLNALVVDLLRQLGDRTWGDAVAMDLSAAQPGSLTCTLLRGAEVVELQRELVHAETDLIHLAGTVSRDEDTGEPTLEFKASGAVEHRRERWQPVPVGALRAALGDWPGLGVVTLHPEPGAGDPLRRLAAELAVGMVHAGAPAVVAMLHPADGPTSAQLLCELDCALASGYALDVAVAEARKAAYAEDASSPWWAPAIFLGIGDAPKGAFDLELLTTRLTSPRSAPPQRSSGGPPPPAWPGYLPPPRSGGGSSKPAKPPKPSAQPQPKASPAPPAPVPRGGSLSRLRDRVMDWLTSREDPGLTALNSCRTVEQIAGAADATAREGWTDAFDLRRPFVTVASDVAAALANDSTQARRDALLGVETRLQVLTEDYHRLALLPSTAGSAEYDAEVAAMVSVAGRWSEVVTRAVRRLEAEVERLQEIESPYVVGMPLREEQPVFVGRQDLSRRLERLLPLPVTPALLLYGQRRMGKTSLMYNLGRFLPSTVVPMFVDLQGPPAQADSEGAFLFHLASAMSASARQSRRGMAIDPPPREAFSVEPFGRFYQWVDEVQRRLGDRTGLLMLDEFEALERAFAAGRIDADAVLGMLRHLIQHRPRLKVLLAGSHSLDAYTNWSTYLINVQVLKVGYLARDEALSLIQQPVPGFPLRYDPSAAELVLSLTRGHPFLLQLMCSEIVALKNEQPPSRRRHATEDDVLAAVDGTLSSGGMYFHDVQQNQVSGAALPVLRAIARAAATGSVSRAAIEADLGLAADVAAGLAAAELDRALAQLVERDLVEQVGGGYRVQVELIRRWFAR
ncbi:MAG TPA: AAA family ATPase [Dermatophilaceae bacterium]|nr:AAA family ATPase [Dermatophilaceae bacterium]